METTFPEKSMHTISSVLLNKLLSQFAQTEQFAFFDTSRPCQENCSSYLFTKPVTRLQCHIDGSSREFLEMVQDWLDKGYYAAGWFGYEFGALLAGRLSGLTSGPLDGGKVVADLGVYGDPLRFDHTTGEESFHRVCSELNDFPGYEVLNLRPNITEKEYLEALAAVKEYILAGDTYQVNLTLKLLFELNGSPEALYRNLRRGQSVGYGAYIRWGDERVMSFSPELFFRRNDDGLVVRPMKGTLRRGRDQEEEREARNFLQEDSKNRSENVMIVDLLRNDLGRVLHEAGGGQVQVDSLFDVETYESLLQMTSTISGKDYDNGLGRLSLHSLFEALFPCGSVTGAPKIRTMEIIAELEKESRGVYTGAIGFLAPDSSGVFNVPIRTIVLNGSEGEMGIGSGVTHDSDSGDEWQECLLKGRFLTEPAPEFLLIETIFHGPEGYWLLDEHLQRLSSSASYFYFNFDRLAIMELLNSHASELVEPARVRLTLAKDGAIKITSARCDVPVHTGLPTAVCSTDEERLPLIRLSAKRTDSALAWFRHKTTERRLYDREFAKAREQGLADYIFLNERGEVTEGSITNIIIYSNGRYLTPPVRSGLLNGVMRRKILSDANPRVEEKVLYPEDLSGAEAIFICNSVRGVVRVRLNRD